MDAPGAVQTQRTASSSDPPAWAGRTLHGAVRYASWQPALGCAPWFSGLFGSPEVLVQVPVHEGAWCTEDSDSRGLPARF